MVSNTLTLTKEIKVECFECIATIRVMENNPYLATVLKLGLDNKKIDERLIIKEILPGEAHKMATNMIRRYRQLGFLDNEGYLTNLGLQAANGEVYMPENGKYLITVSSDPIFQQNIIELKSLDNKNISNEPKEENKGTIPEILSKSIGSKSLIWFNDEIKEILIDEILNFVITEHSEQKYYAELELKHDKSLLKLSRNKSDLIRTDLNYRISLNNIWSDIVSLRRLNWKDDPLQSGFALMKYEDIKKKEGDIKSFTTTIPSLNLHLDDLGYFKTKDIEVRVQPVSSWDATKWALDLISFEIIDYIDEESFNHIVGSVVDKFTVHKPKIPKLKDFINHLLQKSKNADEGLCAEYWYLQAPIDLTLEED